MSTPQMAPVAGSAGQPVDLMTMKQVQGQGPLRPPSPELPDSHRRRNCNPKVMRSTINKLPTTPALLEKTKIPFGIHVYPFGPEPIPVIDTQMIIRCRSCRTYLNPFCTFMSHGRRWRCNMCFRVQDLPADFDYDMQKRTHIDRSERSELKSSSVEYLAPQEYMVRAPQPCIYMFLIDVSFLAVANGMVKTVASTIRKALEGITGDKRTQVGSITYDHTLQFYNLQESLSRPQMMVVPEIDELFIPSPEDLLVNLEGSMEVVETLLESLPAMVQHNQSQHSCLGPALEAAKEIIGNQGGRITIFQASRPSLGSGALAMREDPAANGTEKEAALLAPATDFYKEYALTASRAQISIDLFACANSYIDIATLSEITKFSAGNTFYYKDFDVKHVPQRKRLEHDVNHYLTRPIGLEAVLRLRCTKGIFMNQFYGHFFVRSQDLLSLPNVSPDNGFSFALTLEEDLPTSSPFAFFQVALLYTSSMGDRRIRVHTLGLPTTADLNEVFQSVDSQAVTSLVTKIACEKVIKSNVKLAREYMLNTLVDMMKVYQTAFASGGSSLVVPPSMQLLPLLIQAAMKNTAFADRTDIRLDERAYAMLLHRILPMWEIREYIYPRLYSLGDMEDMVGVAADNKRMALPVLHQLTAANVRRGGLYLIYTGQHFYLWVGKDVPANILTGVFGVTSYAQIQEGLVELPSPKRLSQAGATPEGESPSLAHRINSIIRGLRRQHPKYMMLHIVKEDSPGRQAFINNLLDDRVNAKYSYFEFLQMLQGKLAK